MPDPVAIAPRPSIHVLVDVDGCIEVEPLPGRRGIEGQMRVRPNPPSCGSSGLDEHRSSAVRVQVLRLWLELGRPEGDSDAAELFTDREALDGLEPRFL